MTIFITIIHNWKSQFIMGRCFYLNIPRYITIIFRDRFTFFTWAEWRIGSFQLCMYFVTPWPYKGLNFIAEADINSLTSKGWKGWWTPSPEHVERCWGLNPVPPNWDSGKLTNTQNSCTCSVWYLFCGVFTSVVA